MCLNTQQTFVKCLTLQRRVCDNIKPIQATSLKLHLQTSVSLQPETGRLFNPRASVQVLFAIWPDRKWFLLAATRQSGQTLGKLGLQGEGAEWPAHKLTATGLCQSPGQSWGNLRERSSSINNVPQGDPMLKAKQLLLRITVWLVGSSCPATSSASIPHRAQGSLFLQSSSFWGLGGSVCRYTKGTRSAGVRFLQQQISRWCRTF